MVPAWGKSRNCSPQWDPCPRRSRKWTTPRDGCVVQGRLPVPSSAQSTGWHCISGPMFFWVAMVVLLAGSGTFFLCYWKVFRKRIQQSKCMCLGVLERMAGLFWPGLGACPVCPHPAAHPLSSTSGVFAEFPLDYLAQTLQPKVEQAGEYLAVWTTA